jgi:hypothetical protein
MSKEMQGTSEERSEKSEGSGLKLAQVVAAALAAVTAAVLGSTLGVAGTVLGAGLASVITTVGSELYLRSLRRTRAAALRTKQAALALADPRARPTQALPAPQSLRRQIPGYHAAGYRQRYPQPVHVPRTGAAWEAQAEAPTVRFSVAGEPTVSVPRARGPVPPAYGDDARPEPAEPVRRRWRPRWVFAAAASVLAFVVALLVITGWEGVTGHAVSGGEGSTVGRLVGRAPQPAVPQTTPQAPATREHEPAPTTQAPTSSAPTGTPTPSAPSTSASVPTTSDRPRPTEVPSPTPQAPQPTPQAVPHQTPQQAPQSAGAAG